MKRYPKTAGRAAVSLSGRPSGDFRINPDFADLDAYVRAECLGGLLYDIAQHYNEAVSEVVEERGGVGLSALGRVMHVSEDKPENWGRCDCDECRYAEAVSRQSGQLLRLVKGDDDA